MIRVKIAGRVFTFRERDVSIALGVVLSMISFAISFTYYGNTPYFSTAILFSVAVLLIPFGVYSYWMYGKVKEKEHFFPHFLKDLADSVRAGTTLPRAVLSVSKINYGSLSEDVRRLAAHISWGVPFDEALVSFAERTGSRMIRASVDLINEAYLAGGNVPDILDTVAEDAAKMLDMKGERTARFSGFIATIYSVFVIFLLITLVIVHHLLPEVTTMPIIASASLFSQSFSGDLGISENEFRTFIFHIALIEALFSGLLAGLIGEGKLVAGVKHAFILSFIAFVFFNSFIPAPDPVDRLGRVIVKSSPYVDSTIFVGKFFLDRNVTLKDLRKSIEMYSTTLSLFGRSAYYTIVFEEGNCGPCLRGDVVVTRGGVEVIKPSYISFYVVTNKEEYKYTVRVEG